MSGRNSRALRAGLAVAGLAGAAGAAYPVFLRGRCLTWGATPWEAGRTLPGDELLPKADLLATRAVTINAPADAVWPWLVQMGSGRGGAYTYDRIENLFGLDMHSADEILPEFQSLAAGDMLPMGRTANAMRAEIVDPGRALVFRSADGTWVWAFVLMERNGVTRLVSRNRIAAPGASLPVRLASMLIMEPGSLIMERKMLLGIKSRVERTRRTTRTEQVARAGQAEQARQAEQAGRT